MGLESRRRRPQPDAYPAFARLDGRHPYRDAVPGGSIDYPARRRHDGHVAWFNFPLAREMGLIPAAHPDRLVPALERAVLDTFCLVIVNEWDAARRPVRQRRLLPHPYMATRYLQLQHRCRRGTTSGDGRSVWNGTVHHRGATWDVTSCGTGVTRLCPATALTGEFLRTGNSVASYGCGTASLEDGFAAALMSETFHRNGVGTERVLAVIALDDGYAIVVRAGRNLLRPAHLFAPLKQGDLARLRAVADYWLGRQEGNHEIATRRGPARRYREMVRTVARTFGRTAATFEREYVFCWLAWDGDNVLADGGIIDYGSVRQFGLYHRAYRFDDGPRWSTTIPEQRRQARLIVQTFAQVRDFLLTGTKAPLRTFRRDPALRLFDRTFEEWRDRLLLRNAGFPPDVAEVLLRHERGRLRRFDRAHGYFERARSARGPIPVPDGLTWNAIFSMRDLLRELPALWAADPRPVPAERFLAIGLSSYASRRDRRPAPRRCREALAFQRAWLALIRAAARRTRRPAGDLLAEIARRSARINRRARLTGDSAVWAARRLLRIRRRLGSVRLHRVIERFLDDLVLVPERRPALRRAAPAVPDVRRVLDGLIDLVERNRHGL